MTRYYNVTRETRESTTRQYNLDDWRDLVALMKVILVGKSFKFNDSRLK